MSSILTTDKLIRSIKRRCFIPESQETFTNADFLEIATEEMNFALIPLMMRAQEEHLVYTIDIPFQLGTVRYPIPTRAHGNKIRDIAVVDSSGNVFEMFRYSLDEISDFNNDNSRINNRGFYLQNNEVVLLGRGEVSYDFLRFFIYLRPNALVPFDQGSASTTSSTLFEVDNINPLAISATSISASSTPELTVSSTANLKSGDFVQISSSDSTPSIDGDYQIIVTSATTFTISGITTTIAGTTAGVVKLINCQKFSFPKIPKLFTASKVYDFVQKNSPNKILHWDIPVNSIDFVSNTMSFPNALISKVSVGDFVTLAEESIVPNIPAELHPVLAQRVAVACLEAMGDEQGKVSAERKLKEMETSVGTLLDNRVEGANVKIKNRHGVLKEATKFSNRQRYSR